MDANEGSASICDNNGSLLFYTNGVTVYNRLHQIMLNGSGLLGNQSSVQSSVIVPQPGNNNLYYIFTTDAFENGFANGYNYSIVDITNDNGNGAVITKNMLLEPSCTERMVAVRHADGISVWIITNNRNSNIFKSWLIDCRGLQTNPVISTAGVVLDRDDIMNTGMLKVSPDGKQLCQTHFPIFNGELITSNFFQLFDFDNLTGVISNARTIAPPNSHITSCEYSSNSKLLYLARPYDKAIDQVEATLASPAAIVSSRISISTGNATFYGIQLAPDNKIYLAEPSSFLGAINNPDIKGSGCNFQKDQVNLNATSGSSAYLGLPSFINDLSFDGSNRFDYMITDSCTGTVQFSGISSIPGTLSWHWDFGDNSTSGIQNPVHTFSSATQRYTVTLTIQATGGCGTIKRSKTIIPKGLVLDAGFDFINKCDSGYIRFINTSTVLPDTATLQYLWDFGDNNTFIGANPVHTFSSPGTYNVQLTVKTTNACLDKSFSKPVNLQPLDIHAPPDREIEAGEMVQLNVTGGGSSFTWIPINGLSNPNIINPVARPSVSTMYVVTAFNDAGCKDSDTVFIKVKRAPGIYVPSGFTPNNDGKNDVLRPLVSDEFILQEFSIFNRWGQKIFRTSQKEVGWNGKIKGIEQNPGVYVWMVKAVDTRTGEKQEMKGIFVIIR